MVDEFQCITTNLPPNAELSRIQLHEGKELSLEGCLIYSKCSQSERTEENQPRISIISVLKKLEKLNFLKRSVFE